ncbi:hypothetical protein C8Q72DRAFT_819721 [Fomitopsis betulina]|nr:hypothetical protein C8Q72DRAFT_819721 [Fomitopsis betulina]
MLIATRHYQCTLEVLGVTIPGSVFFFGRTSLASLPLVSVNLATVAIESMFYGMFVLLSSLYNIIAQHWVTTIYRLFEAFVKFADGAELALFCSDIALTTSGIVKTAFCIATLIICDILIIYRLWIVRALSIVMPCSVVLRLCRKP